MIQHRIPAGGRRPHLNPHNTAALHDRLNGLPILLERQDLRSLLSLTDVALSGWLCRHGLECMSTGGRELYQRERVRQALTEAKSRSKINGLRGSRFAGERAA